MLLIEPGTIIDGRYEVRAHLASGGMGDVYEAVEISLERPIALKMLSASLVGDALIFSRFKREGEVLSALSHPGIPHFYRFGLWEDRYPYIAAELLKGETLRQTISEQGTLDPFRVIAIAIQICFAMQAAHQHGVIHRDLKPDNIILTTEPLPDSVKVLDFGIAMLQSQKDREKQPLTQSGQALGSIHYMSPEQCQGRLVDARSDIYALGCLVYELLSGHPPFVSDSIIDLMNKHLTELPTPLSVACSGKTLPDGLSSLVARSLAKEPGKRYQSMDEVRADLEKIVQGRGAEIAGFVDVGAEHARGSLSHRATLWSVCAAILLVTCLTVVVGYYVRSKSTLRLGATTLPFTKVFPDHNRFCRMYRNPTQRLKIELEWLRKYGGCMGVANRSKAVFSVAQDKCVTGAPPEEQAKWDNEAVSLLKQQIARSLANEPARESNNIADMLNARLVLADRIAIKTDETAVLARALPRCPKDLAISILDHLVVTSLKCRAFQDAERYARKYLETLPAHSTPKLAAMFDIHTALKKEASSDTIDLQRREMQVLLAAAVREQGRADEASKILDPAISIRNPKEFFSQGDSFGWVVRSNHAIGDPEIVISRCSIALEYCDDEDVKYLLEQQVAMSQLQLRRYNVAFRLFRKLSETPVDTSKWAMFEHLLNSARGSRPKPDIELLVSEILADTRDPHCSMVLEILAKAARQAPNQKQSHMFWTKCVEIILSCPAEKYCDLGSKPSEINVQLKERGEPELAAKLEGWLLKAKQP